MALELRNVDQLMLSLFDREATYDAGPTGWLAANACSMEDFDGHVGWEDEVVSNMEGVTGSEFPTHQEIKRQDCRITYVENRLKPNTLAGLAALHFGSVISVQDGAYTAYRHKIQPMRDGTATISGTDIAFVNSNPDTITQVAAGFIAAGFKAGQVIVVSGSASNSKTFRIATVAAGTLTLDADCELTAESVGPSITITVIDLPGIGIIEKSGGTQYKYTGVKSNRLSLKLTEGYFGMESELIGSGTRASDSTTFAAKISESWLRTGKIAGAWLETGANISIAATPTQGAENISSATPDNLTTRLLDFTFTHNNNLRADLGYVAGGGSARSALEYGRRDAEVTMKVKQSQASYATELAYYTGQVDCAMELNVDMGTVIDAGGAFKYGFILIVPNLMLRPLAREVQDDFWTISFAGNVFDDGTNPTVLMYVYNAQSQYIV